MHHPARFRVEVNPGRCENRRECLLICPTDVFEMTRPVSVRNPFVRMKILVHGGQIASPSREAQCIGCMACVVHCPEGAITVRALP
jgi:NAD-dependent dihydropyrimidine dehydrogenase PreA subunit